MERVCVEDDKSKKITRLLYVPHGDFYYLTQDIISGDGIIEHQSAMSISSDDMKAIVSAVNQ